MFTKEILYALAIYFIIFLAIDQLWEYDLPFWLAILLYVVVYTVVTQLTKSKTAANNEPEWPTSGPIGRYGQAGLIFSFTLTSTLSLFNPFQLIQIMQQIIGNSYLSLTGRAKDTPAADYHTKATYTLPITGEWFVYNGGIQPATSHSWTVITQRYAYDFVKVNGQKQRHTGAGTTLTDYFCYGADISAAADGTVVHITDGVRDAPFVGYGIADFLARSFIGNHIIIKHADGEYGLYAHLIKGSISVKVGDSVTRGQLIGRCGHSGHSSEPHLHFHLQDAPNFFFAAGVPLKFSQLTVNGTPQDAHFITAGDYVARSAAEGTATDGSSH